MKKEKQLKARLSKARYYKLAQYAVNRDKTITSLIEDWIDSLPPHTPPAIHEGLCTEPASAPCKPRLNTNSKNTV